MKLSPRLLRKTDGILDREAAYHDALIQESLRNTCNFGPFADAARFSFPRNVVVPSSVTHLFGSRRPSAILRSVVLIAVYAVEAVLIGWWIAHIGAEVLEGVEPPLADADTAPAVVLILVQLFVVATALHVTPKAKGASLRHPVLKRLLRCSLLLKTAATLCMPATKIRKGSRGLAAALASADGTLSFKPKDGKTTKNNSDGVVHTWRIAHMNNLRQ